MALFPQGYMQTAARWRYAEDAVREGVTRASGKRWQPDSVKLTTLHASKGLEFHTVAIVGLQAVPDARHAEEEEWRLLYVAMTRATHRLVLAGSGESGAVKRVSDVLGRVGGESVQLRQAAAC